VSSYELSAFRLYCTDMFSLPQSSDLDATVAAARTGSQEAKELIILRCLPYIVKLAYRYQVYLYHDGLEDIVGIGNLAVVECLEKALTKAKPVAYLYKCAQYQILKYITRKSSLIVKPDNQDFIPVVSLEEHPGLYDILTAYVETTPKVNIDLVYEALDCLTPFQRKAVISRYGLYGHTDVSLGKLAKQEGKRYTSNYRDAVHQALKKLNRFLASV
jgi:RNA polymerase sigma factor (sigma-70 family)